MPAGWSLLRELGTSERLPLSASGNILTGVCPFCNLGKPGDFLSLTPLPLTPGAWVLICCTVSSQGSRKKRGSRLPVTHPFWNLFSLSSLPRFLTSFVFSSQCFASSTVTSSAYFSSPRKLSRVGLALVFPRRSRRPAAGRIPACYQPSFNLSRWAVTPAELFPCCSFGTRASKSCEVGRRSATAGRARRSLLPG